MHPVASLQFERMIGEYARWRAVPEQPAMRCIRRSNVRIAVAAPDAFNLLKSDDICIRARRNARQAVTGGHVASARSHPRLIC